MRLWPFVWFTQCLLASRLEFESRKDVVHIFNNLLRRQIGSRWPTVEYLCKRGDVVFETLKGYENEDIALNTGMILKEMLRHESLCKLLLWSDQYVFSQCVFIRLLDRLDSTPSRITLKSGHSESPAMHLQITRLLYLVLF